jgi:hypothetical protein
MTMITRATRTAIAACMGAPAVLLLGLAMLFCLTGEGEVAKVTLGLSAVFGLLALATSPTAQ